MPLAEFDAPTGGPATGRWFFHEQAFQAGLRWIDASPPDVPLIVDEIGPLELEQGRGWFPLLRRLADRSGPVVVPVRPALEASLASAVQAGSVHRVPIDETSREAAELRVMALLELAR